LSDFCDDKKSRFIVGSGTDFDPIRVFPKLLRLSEVNPVFDKIRRGFIT
jgi:hypothetical protein